MGSCIVCLCLSGTIYGIRKAMQPSQIKQEKKTEVTENDQYDQEMRVESLGGSEQNSVDVSHAHLNNT